MRPLILSFAIFCITALSAQANPTLDQSCRMVAALSPGSSEKPTQVSKALFAYDKNLTPATIAGALALLDTLNSVDAGLFETIKIGNFHEVHLITVALKKNSPLYIEMRYQRINENIRLTNIQFKDNLDELLPSLSPGTELKALSC